jgi:CheY-like chemotaxis protein
MKYSRISRARGKIASEISSPRFQTSLRVASIDRGFEADGSLRHRLPIVLKPIGQHAHSPVLALVLSSTGLRHSQFSFLRRSAGDKHDAMADRICLIVDDEGAIRGYLALILKQRQLQTVEAETATQALRVVQKLGGGLDLAVIDISIPGDMNGLDLAHSIRNAFPAIPVILISGYAQGAPAGAASFPFIPKPFVPKTILSVVDRAITSEQRQPLCDESLAANATPA